ncbi:MAG TPA: SpoIIE family protein phosphatase [Candidatus Baltobacteraceae bacterium]|nr:SpoIIE family protein phosphatase [Candidatus Baltobacteraceae bacterium]
MSVTPAPPPARVLIVDDSESSRFVIATWLRRAGHDVREARTGYEALETVDADRFDLVVCDVHLPDMSGYEVCEAIKATRPFVPVLHVSATSVRPADRSEGLRRGADGYLVEPVEREELVATVGALLRGAEAQRTAIRLARRLRRLNEATLALNQARALPTLVETIASEAAVLFDAAVSVALALGGSCLRADAAPEIAAAARPCTADAVDQLRGRSGARSQLWAPLDAPDGQRGTIAVVHAGRTSDEDDVVLAQYARAANIALRNVRSYDVERQIALMLQRNLLPDAVPDLPKLQLATRYEASAQHVEVGGDFYEIFSLGGDRVAFAIGDVVGHSLEAAMVMAQLRTAIRSYLLEGHGPAATIERLNRLLCRFHPDVTATACCAVYDGADGACEVANAGHLPPLLVTNGAARYLPFGGALLGIEEQVPTAHAFTLAADDLLVLFTDGLVERRDAPLEAALAKLAEVAATPGAGIDELADRILRDVGPATAFDDIALVLIRPSA